MIKIQSQKLIDSTCKHIETRNKNIERKKKKDKATNDEFGVPFLPFPHIFAVFTCVDACVQVSGMLACCSSYAPSAIPMSASASS